MDLASLAHTDSGDHQEKQGSCSDNCWSHRGRSDAGRYLPRVITAKFSLRHLFYNGNIKILEFYGGGPATQERNGGLHPIKGQASGFRLGHTKNSQSHRSQPRYYKNPWIFISNVVNQCFHSGIPLAVKIEWVPFLHLVQGLERLLHLGSFRECGKATTEIPRIPHGGG